MYFPNIQCALPITNPAIYFPNIDVFLRQAWQTPAMNASTSRQCTMEWRHRRRSARRSFFFYLFDVWKRKVKAQTCALKHKYLSFSLQGSEEGSFGDCRKQERMAAKFGNKCKQSCPGLNHCHRHISLTNIATNKIIIVIINVLKKPCPCFRQCHYHFKPSLPHWDHHCHHKCCIKNHPQANSKLSSPWSSMP